MSSKTKLIFLTFILIGMQSMVLGSSKIVEDYNVLPPDPLPITIIAGSVSGDQFTEVLLPVTVTNFTNVSDFFIQYSWDTTVASFLGFENIADTSLNLQYIFGTVEADTYSSGEGFPLSLADGDTLFSMRFLLIGPHGSSTTVNPEAFNVDNYLAFRGRISINGIQEEVEDLLTIITESVSGDQLTEVLVPVTVANFTDVSDFFIQYSWDITVASFLGFEHVADTSLNLQYLFGSVEVDTYPTGDGFPISLVDGDTLFSMRFLLIGPQGSSTTVNPEALAFEVDGINVTNYLAFRGRISINGIQEEVEDLLTILAGSVAGDQFTEVLLPVTVANFTDVSDFFIQYSWDTTVASFLGFEHVADTSLNLQYLFGSVEVDTYPTGDGFPISLVDGDTLFSMRFLLIGPYGSSTSVNPEALAFEVDGVNVANYLAFRGRLSINAELISASGAGYGVDSTVSFSGSETSIKIYDKNLSPLSMDLSVEDNLHIKLHPNPVNTYLTVSLWSNIDQLSDLHIINDRGKHVISTTTLLKVGFNEVIVDCSTWSEGVYILNVQGNNQITSAKFLKQ